MLTVVEVPTRDDVDSWWRAVSTGRCSREQAHAWSKPWVEDAPELVSDPITSMGLLWLHGLDLSAGGPGSALLRHGGGDGRIYLRTDSEMAALHQQWIAGAAAFDADPAHWRRDRFAQLLQTENREHGLEHARRLADRLIERRHLTAAQAATVLSGAVDNDGW